MTLCFQPILLLMPVVSVVSVPVPSNTKTVFREAQAGGNLTLDVGTAMGTVVHFQSTNPASEERVICKREGSNSSCLPEFDDRLSLHDACFELRNVKLSDSGVYTFRDYDTDDIISIYNISVSDLKKSTMTEKNIAPARVNMVPWCWLLVLLMVRTSSTHGISGRDYAEAVNGERNCEFLSRRKKSVKSCAIERNWGFSLEELFGLALKFFREMDGKAFHPTYEEKLRLVALHKQVSLGPCNPAACPETGFFDVLGNDRRKEWMRLGSMAKEDAMEDFVKLLNSCCTLFAPYVTSHKIEKEDQERRRREEEERLRLEQEEEERRLREEEERKAREEQEKREREEEEQRRKEEERSQMELHKQQIMAALNAQTAVHFQQYAAQQCPDNPEQQHLLIQQLQERHYQQYIQQACQQQQKQGEGLMMSPASESLSVYSPSDMSGHPTSQSNNASQHQEAELDQPLVNSGAGDVSMVISSPSMWTRPQIGDFKEKMRGDVDSVITVGRGEVLTIRVPTHENGSYLFWEFATDDHDVGFGLYFEWADSLDQLVSAKDRDTLDKTTEEGAAQNKDEREEESQEIKNVQVEEVVPVLRRDSHTEVYAGSHRYPGHGVYLLKFDNSYSLWRSKVVYYRVYYTH
ncbi:Golgi resident protein GCP60 [Chanos chanos]|uniref:Golgi resident protein GCP60 n=1 Tax=Chanos chanos TaxID=29144 RepID=A0A6J2WE13_CHACN|nr:Golgi resident protein GCP60-like [Chanos chanos]